MSKSSMIEQMALLRATAGRHTGLISLFLPHTTRIQDALDHIKQEIVEAENVKDKTNRKNVSGALSAIFR